MTKFVKTASAAGIGIGTVLIVNGMNTINENLPAGALMIISGGVILLTREKYKY